MEDVYLSIAAPASAEIKVRGSRFIASAGEICTLEAAAGFVEDIRRKEHAATHNCFGYRVGVGGDCRFKYSDDGEPSGTAGKPIFDLIEGRNLTNTVVVVTRYFGGTKLGTGGLVRAYSEAASIALDQAGVKENYLSASLQVVIEMGMYNQLQQLLSRFHILEQEAEFSDRVKIRLQVRRSQAESLKSKIVDLSSGRAEIEEQ